MKLMKRVWAALLLLAASGQLYADEGMWVLKELNKQNLARMAELGFTPSYDQLYSETDPCVANAVVIFGGGCCEGTVDDANCVAHLDIQIKLLNGLTHREQDAADFFFQQWSWF